MGLHLKAALFGAVAGTLWTLAVLLPRLLLLQADYRPGITVVVWAKDLKAGRQVSFDDLASLKVLAEGAEGSVVMRAQDAVGRTLACEARAGERVILGCLK